ncbi:histidine kinase [Stappia sp. F7233]|uniref:histidine kinase n=1 Tax=Stappia albiluteola TaxID=2758565 RepID=A0A839AB10_9HYPH|nr:ATP-binding protein [Stappia albiluteola]MBA5776376.1 histidine kinase [Stappia albiluteola]
MAQTEADTGPRTDDRAVSARSVNANGGRRSLAGRLITVATLWSVVALAVAGFILVALYRQASERGFDDRLDLHLKAIIGAMAGGEPGKPNPPENLGEPRFELPVSGWYWLIADDRTGEVVHASLSLLGDALALPEIPPSGVFNGTIEGPEGEELRVAERRIVFGQEEIYRIAVAGGTDELRDQITAFAGQVALTLTIFGLGLVGAIFLQVRVGLRPLRDLRASVAAVRNGDAESVEEDLPRELQPLAVELNDLIHSNREIVERARTHVGNLAHALKTPLSVITNEARSSPGPLADKVAEQAAVMRTQVDHHLERARMAAQRRVIGVSAEMEPVVASLVRAMAKIYRDRNIAFSVDVPHGIRFRGEKQDLEELVGNLLDNACKWTRSRVDVSVQPMPGSDRGRDLVAIEIADDGPGLTEGERKEAVKRGRRLDETVPGTGLGLSIVADISAIYGGRLELHPAPAGGLLARLVLPAAQAAGS